MYVQFVVGSSKYFHLLPRQIGTPNIAKTTTSSQADGQQGLGGLRDAHQTIIARG